MAWDKTLKVGDLIVAYRKGFHEITRIEPRRDHSPLVHYKERYMSNGKPSNRKTIHTCCGGYCKRASEVLPERIKEAEDALTRLKGIK